MDRKSLQILKYMHTVDCCDRKELLRMFGKTYTASLDFLLSEKYLAPGSRLTFHIHMSGEKLDPGVKSIETQRYHITGHGLGYLEHYHADLFLRWAPLVLSIYAAGVSTFSSIILPLLQHFHPELFQSIGG